MMPPATERPAEDETLASIAAIADASVQPEP